MSYRFPPFRIHEIVRDEKCLTEGEVLIPPGKNSLPSSFGVNLDLVDGPFCDLRFLGKAVHLNDPSTYHTNLLLEQQRVRGIGYNPIGRQKFRSNMSIPKGWHENVCDPNAATDHPDRNRHVLLNGFEPTDYSDFIRKSAQKWNIDLGWEEGLI